MKHVFSVQVPPFDSTLTICLSHTASRPTPCGTGLASPTLPHPRGVGFYIGLNKSASEM